MSKLKVLTVSAISLAALGTSVAFASGASASTTNVPAPLPRACAVHTFQGDNLRLNLGASNFNYQVRLRLSPVLFQRGVLVVSGTLCDANEPIPMVVPVHGIIFGHVAVISVSYPTFGPDAGNQGVRTFVGVIGPFGHRHRQSGVRPGRRPGPGCSSSSASSPWRAVRLARIRRGRQAHSPLQGPAGLAPSLGTDMLAWIMATTLHGTGASAP